MGFLIAGTPVFAQASILSQQLGMNAGILPDNPLYRLKGIFHSIQLFFTFDPAERAKLHYELAEEKLAEADEMINKGKIDLALNSKKLYEDEINAADIEEERAVAFGRNITALVDHVNNETYKHILVLQGVLEKVPINIKPIIQRTIDLSMEKQGQIVGRIDGRNLINISITIGNETKNYTLPMKFVSKFLEKSEKLQIKIEHRNELIGNITNKTQEMVNESQSELNQFKAEINATNVTTPVSVLLREAESHLDKAKIALNESKYGEAWGQATASLNLIKTAERIYEKQQGIKINRTENETENESTRRITGRAIGRQK